MPRQISKQVADTGDGGDADQGADGGTQALAAVDGKRCGPEGAKTGKSLG